MGYVFDPLDLLPVVWLAMAWRTRSLGDSGPGHGIVNGRDVLQLGTHIAV
jgi:hypothetical protein